MKKFINTRSVCHGHPIPRASLEDQLGRIGIDVAHKKGREGVSKSEERLFYLLADSEFQKALVCWLTSWEQDEKMAAQEAISEFMIKELRAGG